MFKSRRATSLIELIITLTIFVTVAMISVIALTNVLKATKKIQSQVFLYTEAQALMDTIAREVEETTIDYEAYYDREVQNNNESWITENYGYYGQSFIDPGTGGLYSDGPQSDVATWGYYGVECPSSPGDAYPDDCPTETAVYSDGDLDTGSHPFEGIDSFSSDYFYNDLTSQNAFCESRRSDRKDCTDFVYHVQDQLILINSAGDERTVFILELADNSSDYRLSKIKMSGTDTDSDGLVDTWKCTDDYRCTAGSSDAPDYTDLEDGDQAALDNFRPLTPSALTVDDFYVYITPLEDPYRAFSEEEIQIQPQVTIVLTMSISEDYASGFLGDTPTISIQRTVSTGVYSEVTSYE